MSFAIKNALVAVPALATLLLGIVFIILAFVLVIRAISIMPLLRRALKIYVAKNAAYAGEDTERGRVGFFRRIFQVFKQPPRRPGERR